MSQYWRVLVKSYIPVLAEWITGAVALSGKRGIKNWQKGAKPYSARRKKNLPSMPTRVKRVYFHIIIKIECAGGGGKDFAEGYIPDCVFTRVEGFTDDEVSQMTDYLKANLTDLKKRAAYINPLTGLMVHNSDKRYACTA